MDIIKGKIKYKQKQMNQTCLSRKNLTTLNGDQGKTENRKLTQLMFDHGTCTICSKAKNQNTPNAEY